MTLSATHSLTKPEPLTGLVSVVMPILDESPWITEAISGVLGQTHENLELLIADGGSTDGTLEIVEALAQVDARIKVIDNHRRLQAAGLNEALSRARGEFLVRLDARSFVDADYVHRCVEGLVATGAAVVGGRMVPVAQTHWFARGVALANRRPWGAGPARFHHSDRAGPAETVYLGSFRRDVVQDLGGWSEHAGVNEDFELNHRIRGAGHVVWFDPGLRVGYQPRSNVRGLVKQYLRYGRSKATVIRQHPSSVRVRQVVPALLAPAALLAFVPRLRGAGLAALVAHGLVVGGGAVTERERPEIRLSGALAGWLMHWSWSLGFWWGALRPFPSATRLAASSKQDPSAEAVDP